MKFAMICLAAALAVGPCFAQSDDNKVPEPARYYRVDFVVKELEAGKVITARTYSTTLSSLNRENTSIRTGDKVPVPNGNSNGYSFFDIGVNIDSRVVRATDTFLVLSLSADMSNMVASTTPASGMALPPVVRQNKWTANVVVPLKKATTVFSSDGASEKRQMQMDVTVTPIL